MTAGKTVPELTPLAAPVQDADVLALYRTPGPLRRTTAATFADYVGGKAGLSFDTQADAEASSPVPAVTAFVTLGYSAAGDGGEALWVSVGSEPSHPGKLQTANLRWFELSVPRVVVDMLGAKRDSLISSSGTDSTTAIQNAIDAASALNVPVAFLKGTNGPFDSGVSYRISAALTVPVGVDVLFDVGAWIYDLGAGNYVAMTIGDASEANQYRNIGGAGGIGIVRSPVTDWSSEDSVACRIIRASDVVITTFITRGHTIGLQINGDGGGSQIIAVLTGHHLDHKVSIDLLNADVDGYANQILFSAGRCSVGGGINTTLDRTGLRVRSERTDNTILSADGAYYNDNILLLNTTFEMNKSGSGRAIAIQIDHGREIQGINIRDEQNDVFLISNNLSRHITMECGYSDSDTTGTGRPVVEINGAYNSVTATGPQLAVESTAATWASKPGWWAHDYAASQLSMIDCAIADSGGTANNISNGGMTLSVGAYLEIPTSRGLVRRIAVKAGMGVTVRRKTAAGYPGRLLCRVYDTSATVLTGATVDRANSTAYSLADKRLIPNIPNMYLECTTAGTSGASVPTWTYNAGDTITDGSVVWTVRKNHVRGDFGYFSGMSTAWASAYGNTSDTANDQTLWFAQDGYADIIVSGGSAACRLTDGFTIEGNDGYALNTWHPMNYEDGVRYGTRIPTLGSFRRGEEIRNATPSAGSVPGWISISTGTPGTWVSLPALPGVSTNGDAAGALVAGTSNQTQIWTTPLTADRAVTLSTTGPWAGARFRVVRQVASTGAFNLNVGAGPLKALAAGTWCDVEYTGSSWALVGYGAL